MLTANRIEEQSEPKKIQYLGDGSFYYNYDITPIIKTINNGETEEEQQAYSFIQVRLYGSPNYDALVKAIIRAYVDQDQEFDFINSASRITLGLSTDETALNDYKEYLELVSTIKEKVKADLS
jgi:hypothetical protein